MDNNQELGNKGQGGGDEQKVVAPADPIPAQWTEVHGEIVVGDPRDPAVQEKIRAARAVAQGKR